MKSTSKYAEAYEAAQKELLALIAQQEVLEKRKVSLRKTIETLGSLCESEGIEIPLILTGTIEPAIPFSDEIRAVVRAAYPAWLRPNQVKEELSKMGVPLDQYGNVQAAIQTILRRMAIANEVEEATLPNDGRKAYRWMKGKLLAERLPEQRVTKLIVRKKKD